MRLLLLGSWLALLVSTAAAQVPADASPDERAVRALVLRYTQARELSDPKAIAALFTSDADQYTSAGEWRRGVSQLVAGMLETSKRNPGVRAIEIQAVRFLTPDIAVVDGRYTAGQNDRPLWTTLIAKREPGGWRIAAIRNSAPVQ